MFISNLNPHKLNRRRYFPRVLFRHCSVNKTHQNSMNLLKSNQSNVSWLESLLHTCKTLKFFRLECTLSLMINNRNPQFYNCTLLLYLMWYCSIVEIPLRFIWHKTTACAPGSWQAKRTPQIFEGESFLAFFFAPHHTQWQFVYDFVHKIQAALCLHGSLTTLFSK
jgi:hypothetical protein